MTQKRRHLKQHGIQSFAIFLGDSPWIDNSHHAYAYQTVPFQVLIDDTPFEKNYTYQLVE